MSNCPENWAFLCPEIMLTQVSNTHTHTHTTFVWVWGFCFDFARSVLGMDGLCVCVCVCDCALCVCVLCVCLCVVVCGCVCVCVVELWVEQSKSDQTTFCEAYFSSIESIVCVKVLYQNKNQQHFMEFDMGSISVAQCMKAVQQKFDIQTQFRLGLYASSNITHSLTFMPIAIHCVCVCAVCVLCAVCMCVLCAVCCVLCVYCVYCVYCVCVCCVFSRVDYGGSRYRFCVVLDAPLKEYSETGYPELYILDGRLPNADEVWHTFHIHFRSTSTLDHFHFLDCLCCVCVCVCVCVCFVCGLCQYLLNCCLHDRDGRTEFCHILAPKSMTCQQLYAQF